MSAPDLPPAVAELADRFFGAIQHGDLDAAADCYTDDAVVWHNDDESEQPRDVNLRVLGWMIRHLREPRYTDVRRYAVPGGFVQQHVLRAEAPGGALVLPAMMRVEVRDDAGALRISRIEEYYDTGRLSVLRPPASSGVSGE